jgi:5'-nucleotidase
MDFDHTISSASSLTSYGIFSDVPFASQKFIAARKKQFQYFRNEELNPNYPKDQWNKIMKQWAEEAIDLISQHVDEHYMEKLISHAQKNMRIRDGVIEFCKELKKLEIPLIVFSAGVKNVIQPVLEANHIPYDALHANILSFDET